MAIAAKKSHRPHSQPRRHIAEEKAPRTNQGRYPELSYFGEKVQIDVKEVPYVCLRGALRRNGKHSYRWTAIDQYTQVRFVYGFEERTPKDTVKFPKMLVKAFPFPIQTIQTDSGTEFTYKYQ